MKDEDRGDQRVAKGVDPDCVLSLLNAEWRMQMQNDLGV